VLRITAVSAGAVEYLIRGSGCSGQEHSTTPERGIVADHAAPGAQHSLHHDGRPAGGAAGYFGKAVRSGEAPGRWLGSGLALLGVDPTRPACEDAVRAVFGRLQHPETG
jgi:hypothetical protein